MPALALLLVAIGCPAFGTLAARAQTGAAKPHSTRKIFDLTPPHPGEILANPSKGSGSPPQLKEFAPSAAMHLSQDVADEATAGASSQDSADPGGSAAGPRALAAGPPVRESDLQMQLSDAITRLGIEGFLARPPQGDTAQERAYWPTIKHEIAASLATWQTLYAPSTAPTSTTPPLPPNPAPEPRP